MPLRRASDGPVVETAFERGWGELENGELVQQAESAGFDLLITTDKNLRYQQNLRGRRLAILVLWTTNWPSLRLHSERIAQAARALGPGEAQKYSVPQQYEVTGVGLRELRQCVIRRRWLW